jgi:hypothetical protein
MKLICDFSDLTNFANRLADTHTLDTHLMTATKAIAQVLHKHLLRNTPVLTGNLRKMWSAGDNLLFTVDQVDGGFQVTLVNKARSGNDAITGDESTGFMYGVAVNDGHSTPTGGWVMGRFFVEKSIVQSELKAEKIIEKELDKWFRWCKNGK